MIVVGAIVAATVSMSDAASAAPHRHLYGHASGFVAHLPHRTSATGFRFARPVFQHVAASRGFRLARRAHVAWRQAPAEIVSDTPRASHGWHRAAMRRRVALAYQAVPFAGPASAPLPVPSVLVPSLLTPSGAAPNAATPAAAPVFVDRRGVRHRFATRRRAALAYNAVPAPAASLMPFSAPAAPATAAPASHGQTGRASYYGGRGLTAAGGHVGAATCAHRSLPFGTRVLVTNLANARSAVLTVNDRGPFVRGRIVDVSVGAAGMLGMLHSGTAPVRVQVVSR